MENSAVFSEEAADEIEKNHVFHVYEQISDHFSETRYDHKEIWNVLCPTNDCCIDIRRGLT